jgi:sporulation integral membrane protein YlbJ
MASAVRIIPFFILALAMFYYPQDVVVSAANGLNIWWKFVLPALFPFFILSELLMGAGFVHFLGVLLEPLMRPLFHLPGRASFVIAMSFTSGIPIGAVLTSKLRQQNVLTREEGERLLTFTCNPSPGFMFGAVASSMMGKPNLGFVLAGSVYISALLIGILFRFYKPEKSNSRVFAAPSLKRAYHELRKAQAEENRPFGQLLGDAIRQSVNTILQVGGFIMFFSVLVHLLEVVHITNNFGSIIHWLTGGVITTQGVTALVTGFLETTLGCRSSIEAFSTLHLQVGVLAALLGWGGLSAFAQVASFTSMTDLRFAPFIVGRTLHALFAFVISQIFLWFKEVPVMQPGLSLTSYGFLETWRLSVFVFGGVMAFLFGVSLMLRFVHRR